ncbi:tRNA-queuosine alpha-mannosyltransferase domain-containing protein [Marinicella rhabdoformis]|uniref:tRNA-queuosine alpha-mannosyltransferase domain-containing protein n=1 Tax=Marinicella rhabdoformis TaxID=2580566 RepID=UPI0012AEC5DC|nr:DUF3524 domain-containing protein [Marinicella rhabdoformis]
MKRILLLSGYDAKSHRYWRQHLVHQIPEYHWTVLALKDRHFSWRMGGNALNFATDHEHALNQSYDLIFATSMTDLCGIFGLFPKLAQIPSLLYFHENQMAYPASKAQPDVIHYQLNSIKSAIAAKQLIFNTPYNQETFLTGVNKFEQMVPDGFPRQLSQQLGQKSHVIPVPLTEDCFGQNNKASKDKHTPLTVTWNHRWEYDKGPDTLLKVLELCQQESLNIKFNIIGQQFRQTPDAFKKIQTSHSGQISHWGYVDKRSDYLRILRQSNVVLSTAHHEFQGLAVMEAIAQGCVPLLPARLAYPNYCPKAYLYDSQMHSPVIEAQSITKRLKKWQHKLPESPDVSAYDWTHLKPLYQDIIINN